MTGNNRQSGHMSADTILDVQSKFLQERILTENDLIYVTHFMHNA